MYIVSDNVSVSGLVLIKEYWVSLQLICAIASRQDLLSFHLQKISRDFVSQKCMSFFMNLIFVIVSIELL